MSGLFAAQTKGNSSVPTRAVGVNLNSSVYGKPISIVYGTTRTASNLLLYGNFSGQAQFSQSSAGGKGGGGGGSQVSGYSYTTSVAFALCEGPIKGIGTVWLNKDLHALSDFPNSFFTGTFPQTAWTQSLTWTYVDGTGSTHNGTVTTKLGYNGIAYVAFPTLSLGNSPSLPNFQFEVQGLLSTTASPASTSDADPSQVLTDILTNANHGLGFSTSKLGSLTAYQAYCMASGLVISPSYDAQRTGADIIDELGVATNSAPVWTSGKFSLIPYGDMAITANGFTYTPPTAVYSLTDNDFIKSPQGGGGLSGGASGPVVLERKRGTDKTNAVKIEFLDRANNYAPSVAYANDQALIDIFGLRSNGSKQLHLFCNSVAANLSAHLQLRRLARISNYYYFDLDQRYILIDPMDILQITDSALGLTNFQVRVLEIQENDNGTLSLKCEEYLGTQGQPLFNFGSGAGYNTNPNTAAQSINVPIIFEPPSALLGGQGTNPQVWVAACGGSTTATDQNWGGANVWLATPSTAITYAFVGQITNPARMGYLTAVLAQHSGNNPDSTSVLSVDLTESGGTLLSGSAADAQVANTLCLLDNELLSYSSAALVSGNLYNLTGLYRGLYGTGNVAHLPGAQFARLDGAIFKFELNATYINQPLLVKLQSINKQGKGEQNLSACTAYQYVPAGTAVLHPLGQALNIGNVDSGVLSAGQAAVFEDYGFLASQVPDGTVYHMPIGADLGALGGAFSIQFSSGGGLANPEYRLASLVKQESAAPVVASGVNTSTVTAGKGTWATWFSRSTFRTDSVTQIIFGQESYFSTGVSTAGHGNGSLYVGCSTDNKIILSGTLGNINSVAAGAALVSTNFSVTSTVLVNSSGWHQLTVGISVSTSTSGFIKVYLDNSTVIIQTVSSGLEFPGNYGGGYYQRQIGRASAKGAFTGDPQASTARMFVGYLAETYFVDGQTLTSTSFTASSVGPVISFTGFIGIADQYLNYANPNQLGLDLSGEFNLMQNAGSGITSTCRTLVYPS